MTPTEPTSLTGRFLGIAELLDHHGFYSAELQTSAELLSTAIAGAKKQRDLHYTKKNGITYVARQTAVYSLAADGHVQLALVPTNLFAALAPAVRAQFEKSVHKDHYVASPEEVREALQQAQTFNVDTLVKNLGLLTRCTDDAHHMKSDYSLDISSDAKLNSPPVQTLAEALRGRDYCYTPHTHSEIGLMRPIERLRELDGKVIVVPCTVSADTSYLKEDVMGNKVYHTNAGFSLAGMDLQKPVTIIGNWISRWRI